MVPAWITTSVLAASVTVGLASGEFPEPPS
jgi:hypothetical protein